MKWWSTDDITAKWLTEVVGTPVVGFSLEPLDTRHSSVPIRVHLDTAGGCGPHSVVIKVANPLWSGSDEPHRREHLFFGRPPGLDAHAVTRCLSTEFDPARGRFWVVLADSGPAAPGDDLGDVSRATAFLAVTALADVHAAFHEPAATDPTAWVPADSPIERVHLGERYVRFVERYGERIAQRHTAVANRIVASVDAINEHALTSAAQRGIVHGDFRLDNLLLGGPGSHRPITITNWHRMCWGPAATDLAIFLGTALDRDTRLAIGDDLLLAYFDALGDAAPESVEALRRDVRDRAFAGLVNAIRSSTVAQASPRNDELWLTLFARACDYLVDLDAPPRHGPRHRTPTPTDPSDELPHRPERGQLRNEAWYFDVVDVAAGIGAYVRFGVAPGNTGGFYSGAISGPGIPTISLFDTGLDLTRGLSVDTGTIVADHDILEPLTHVRVTVAGTGQAVDHPDEFGNTGPARTVAVRMDLRWYSSGAAHRYDLASLYEIPCVVTGTITLDGDGLPAAPIRIDAPGQRDHSWGVHVWWDIEWFWMSAHFDDGTHVHGLDIRVAGLPPMSLGYTQPPDSPLVELDKCRLIDITENDGVRQTMTFVLEPGSTTLTFRAVGQGPQRKVDDTGRESYIPRAWGVVTRSDGRQGVGWVEWNRRSPNL